MGEIRCPHCETEVDEHEASRCLDAWVAEVVLGHRSWRVVSEGEEFWREGMAEIVDLRFYSTDIAAAWEVVGRAEIITVCRAWDMDGNQKGWTAFADDPSTANADTAPLAICRAALKGLGE